MADKEPKLRFSFVEMLFALTAGEIAIQAADLVRAGTMKAVAVPGYTHLLVATALVATSWVGWFKSKAAGAQIDVETVFSPAFLVLLLDVFLVVCYFIIVRGVDVEKQGDSIVGFRPSSQNESFWSMIVFGSYFSWDVLTKGWVGKPPGFAGFRGRLLKRVLWDRAWITLSCSLLVLLLWVIAGGFTKTWSVVAVDVALIAIVFLFRALKEHAYKWAAFLFSASLVAGALAVRLNHLV